MLYILVYVLLQEEEEEAMSKPVTMTPFELRKLYIETFPYSKHSELYISEYFEIKGLTFHINIHYKIK
jgi:hypothetical protein